MMESTYNLRLVSYFIYGSIIHILLVASVQTTSVHLGPAEGFRQFSDVIFPGELFILQCVWDGLTTCNISMSFNDTSIYEEGGFQSQDSGFTNSRSSNCSLNIQINNVNLQHKGIYKCLVQNGDKTMEDTYELNVVTESPQCLTKFNEYENSFQLLCYTFSPTGSYVPQTWEVVELGVGLTTFTEFAIKNGPSNVKPVGVSYENINKENQTGQYKCSYALEASKSCIFTLNCSRGIDISTSYTSVPPTRINRSMSTLRHTSPPPDTSKQPAKKPTWIVIIVVTAATVLLIVCASLTVIIYKMKNSFSERVNKNRNTAQVGNDLAQTTVVFSRSSDTANSEQSSTYQAIQEDLTDSNNVPHSMRNEGELPLTVPSTVYSTSIYMFQIKDRKNASKSAESEENENPAAAAAYSMRIYNTTDQTMYETAITTNTNDTYDYADQRELNTRELPRQSYGTPTVQQYETAQ